LPAQRCRRFCIRAWLQPCRKPHKMRAGFSPAVPSSLRFANSPEESFATRARLHSLLKNLPQEARSVRAWLQPCREIALSTKDWALAPVMAQPGRNASAEGILSARRTFFVTTSTAMGRSLFQSERNAMLFVEVLRSYAVARKFQVHDFVVMPDHVHLLLTVGGEMSIEKAVQLVKGGFSFRLKKECGYNGEVWQRGFRRCVLTTGRAFCGFANTSHRTR
jgi:REP element-mobilizing transposase RayT